MAGRSGAEWLWRMIYSSMQGRYCSRPKKRQRQVNRHSLAWHDWGMAARKMIKEYRQAESGNRGETKMNIN
ncbi:hypothetical protein SJ059_30085, partial [Klebsiella aerogenes]|nr:hypothetical protein [Klebsiella aerogenes]